MLKFYCLAHLILVLTGTWQFPPDLAFKLNCDAAIFSNLNCSGMIAIIRNGKGEIMEAMSTKGPLVRDSDMEAMNSILTPGAN